MRENLKRVSVVLPENLIQLADEYKDMYHGSRSQLLREALVEYVEGIEEEKQDRSEMRPLVRRLESLKKSVKNLDEEVTNHREEIKSILEASENSNQRATEDIKRLLLEKSEGLTILDMGEYLNYTQEELIEGVEALEEAFLVERVESKSGLPKWRIRGCRRKDG